MSSQFRREPVHRQHYEAVGAAFEAMRRMNVVVTGLVVAVTAIWAGPIALPIAAVILAYSGIDALYRRRRPVPSPLVPLYTDATFVGMAVVAGGPWPTFMVAATAYLASVSLLLLPGRKVLVLGAYTLAWFVAGHLFSFDLFQDARQIAAVNYLIALLLLQVTAFVVFRAVRAMRHVWEREARLLAEERKASEMKTEFVSMVSHELRTPLTSIAGFADTLLEGWRSLEPVEVEEFLGIIRDQAAHLGNLVEDILVIPRLDAGRVRMESQLIDLRPLVMRVVDVAFPQDAEREAAVIIPGEATAWADPTRVQQVIRNLLDNARKYGGNQVVVEISNDGPVVKVSVVDDGPGIPPDDRERIFEHFEQLTSGDARTASGVGLGLPIAKRLVAEMGGNLWFEPGFPRGARFCFTLAARPPADQPTGAAAILRRSA